MRVRTARNFVAEPAVTGRSLCRVCGRRIRKGTLRIGRPDWFASGIRWHHPGCLDEPLVLAEVFEQLGRPPSVATGGEPLPDQAARLVRVGRTSDPAALAEGLLALWTATRSPSCATALARLDGLQGGSVPARPEAAGLVSAAPDALAAGARIRAIGRLKKVDLVKALARAGREPPDPRWVDLVLGCFQEPPYRFGPESWDAIAAVLDRAADPRVLPAVQRLVALDVGTFRSRFGAGAVALGPWCVARASGGYPRVTRPSRELSAGEQEALATLTAILEATSGRQSDGRGREADLLHAAAAGDDGALAVLADRWSGRDDPRGEWVLLELLGRRRTPAQRARRKELQKAWRSVAGELAPILLRRGLRWRRGLVVGASVVPARASDRDRILGSPDWASVEHLDLRTSPAGKLDLDVAYAPHARRLTSLTLPGGEALRALFTRSGSPPPVTEIHIDGWLSFSRRPTRTRHWPSLQAVIGRGGRYEREWVERELGVPIRAPTS